MKIDKTLYILYLQIHLQREMIMPGLLPDIDPDGLLEYSVVYTDRALNHMSQSFQHVICDISATLKEVYAAAAVAIVPGSGTFGMEAVARQFATGKNCLVIRNGFFSYRWSQIFAMGAIPAGEIVLKARPTADDPKAPFAPAPIEEVIATIEREKPDLVFAPHVETSAGIILPDDYLCAVADAIHRVGGLFVLDCVASGAIWVDMKACGIDLLISAPQKGWSGPSCAGLVMFSPGARDRLAETASSSFAVNLQKWVDIVESYESGTHAYHATMPTDALAKFRDIMAEVAAYGFDQAKAQQQEMGNRVRALLAERGVPSVAAAGFEAPGVVVSYIDAADTPARFAAAGLQIAAGVPLMCNEPEGFQTFRLGLFGLDKIQNVERTVTTFAEALDQVL